MGEVEEGDHGADMSGLDGVSLISQCFKQIWMHGGLYLSILVFILLPAAAVHQEQEILLFSEVTPFLKQEVFPRMSQEFYGNITDVKVPVKAERGRIIQMTVLALAAGLLEAVFSAIQYISIVYTVASFLTNKKVGLADAAGAVGRLWKPVVFTSLCLFAAKCGVMTSGAAIMYQIYRNQWSGFGEALSINVVVLGWLLLAFIDFAFQMGLIVPALEGVYGWKALGKSWKLLKGKQEVSLGVIILIFLLFKVVELLFQLFLHFILLLLEISIDSTTGSVLNFVQSLVMSSVYIMLRIGTQTFLYFSCKALHQESITNSTFFQTQVRKEGYKELTQHPEKYDV